MQVWDGTQCKRVRTFGGHQTRAGVLAWNSRILSSGSRDRNILQHDLRVSSDYICKLAGHKSEVKLVALNYKEKKKIIARLGERVLFYFMSNILSLTFVIVLQVCGLKWSHDDRELASGGNDNQVIIITITHIHIQIY